VSGGEAKVTEHFAHNAAATLESSRHQLKPLATPGGGWERDLRVSTPALPNSQCGLKPKAAATECFSQKDIDALEARGSAAAPTAKQSPHFEIKNAETIEDNKHG
jgi:hypothetical protein